jgi:hypothetical protein
MIAGQIIKRGGFVKSILSISLMGCALLITMAIFSSATKASAHEPGAGVSNRQQQEGADDNTSSANISGDWQGSWTSADGNQHPIMMQIKQKGSKLTGTFTGQRGSTSLKGGINGHQVSFSMKARRQISFTGTVDGNKMSGTFDQGAPLTATRQQ